MSCMDLLVSAASFSRRDFVSDAISIVAGEVMSIILANCMTNNPGPRLADDAHLKIALARRAIRAGPGFGHIFPARACGDPFIGHAFRFVVNERAQRALPYAMSRRF